MVTKLWCSLWSSMVWAGQGVTALSAIVCLLTCSLLGKGRRKLQQERKLKLAHDFAFNYNYVKQCNRRKCTTRGKQQIERRPSTSPSQDSLTQTDLSTTQTTCKWAFPLMPALLLCSYFLFFFFLSFYILHYICWQSEAGSGRLRWLSLFLMPKSFALGAT